ncbi:MAG: TetR/AcrR family transcriptional regulator [Kineosporiaceae bacterium]|nr:TetR/AcrR family transcriptional regulator [Kineosporiaceae bacterium]MBK7623558.1 TetR/AcrR family transcriptional regulator [Kineosporiaceae bacterium]MBK8077902.1 TetR/AcrR family transcriptional regulator [Kineosporiaceae bacterium]
MSEDDWLTGSCPGLRKPPQQARSRSRVLAILAAAQQIIVRDGLDGLSMRGLAEEAGVPIGTVYQFFVDKAGVLDTLVHRHGLSMQGMIDEIGSFRRSHPWQAVIAELYRLQVERLRADPAYVAIWVERQLSPMAQRQDDRDVETFTDLLTELLVAQEHLVPSDRLRTVCRVATQAADSLLYLAFRVDPAGDPTTLEEALRILQLYLADIAADPRHRP